MSFDFIWHNHLFLQTWFKNLIFWVSSRKQIFGLISLRKYVYVGIIMSALHIFSFPFSIAKKGTLGCIIQCCLVWLSWEFIYKLWNCLNPFIVHACLLMLNRYTTCLRFYKMTTMIFISLLTAKQDGVKYHILNLMSNGSKPSAVK